MELRLEEDNIVQQEKIKLHCENELFKFFDASLEFTEILFPNASAIGSTIEGETSNPLSISKIATRKIKRCKSWIKEVLEKAILVTTLENYENFDLKEINLPHEISLKISWSVLEILSCGYDLTDNGLLFLNDIKDLLGIDVDIINKQIDQILYKKRSTFTQTLISSLTEDQLFWVACMLWRAVHIDDNLHQKEYKYFQNIYQLLQHDQNKFDHLNDRYKKITPIIMDYFSYRFSSQIFKYIVEIVMADEEYTAEEAEFIKEMGKVFNFDKHTQDKIIQPIASALMLRSSLFG